MSSRKEINQQNFSKYSIPVNTKGNPNKSIISITYSQKSVSDKRSIIYYSVFFDRQGPLTQFEDENYTIYSQTTSKINNKIYPNFLNLNDLFVYLNKVKIFCQNSVF